MGLDVYLFLSDQSVIHNFNYFVFNHRVFFVTSHKLWMLYEHVFYHFSAMNLKTKFWFNK